VKQHTWSCPARQTAIVLVALLLSACSGIPYRRSLGIRPDPPHAVTPVALTNECKRLHPTIPPDQTACEQYLKHVQWAQQLTEAYRSRATLNESVIYVGGTIALAGLSVVSGLGIAAAASTETLGLIGVSTGFTSGFLAFMNNSAKAGFYTVAANKISTALADANKKVTASPTSTTYSEATQLLAEEVSQAANELETERYQLARAAAMSQQVQQATQDRQERLAILETALLIGLEKKHVSENDEVVAVTLGIDLTKYEDRVSVWVDGRPVGGDVISQTKIKFRVPAPVVPESKTANVMLHVLNTPVRGQQTLIYQQPCSETSSVFIIRPTAQRYGGLVIITLAHVSSVCAAKSALHIPHSIGFIEIHLLTRTLEAKS
jgi:hypothetical protein